ncbi:hypothetical protein [Devosia sp.]|uniref:hypothetical protein n=1 Tax=Devosia sp. TaxID=1871048 RepID=UPI003A90A634
MLLRALATSLLLGAAAVSPVVPVTIAQTVQTSPAAPVSELVHATGLDAVFTQFGPSLMASAREERLTRDPIFLEHWDAATREVFDPVLLQRELERQLLGAISTEDIDELLVFCDSPFGQRITALERAVSQLPPGEQGRVIGMGQIKLRNATALRRAHLDEMMDLTSAETFVSLVGQSVRAMLLGMSLFNQNGDIDIPWADIDAQVDAMMPTLMTDLLDVQKAMLAYTYADLDADNLERYLRFLRTPAAQTFYARANTALATITASAMHRFGAALARRLARVDV